MMESYRITYERRVLLVCMNPRGKIGGENPKNSQNGKEGRLLLLGEGEGRPKPLLFSLGLLFFTYTISTLVYFSNYD